MGYKCLRLEINFISLHSVGVRLYVHITLLLQHLLLVQNVMAVCTKAFDKASNYASVCSMAALLLQMTDHCCRWICLDGCTCILLLLFMSELIKMNEHSIQLSDNHFCLFKFASIWQWMSNGWLSFIKLKIGWYCILICDYGRFVKTITVSLWLCFLYYEKHEYVTMLSVLCANDIHLFLLYLDNWAM